MLRIWSSSIERCNRTFVLFTISEFDVWNIRTVIEANDVWHVYINICNPHSNSNIHVSNYMRIKYTLMKY